MNPAFAPAKVNLYLHVAAPDAEGYHPLSSLAVFADVGDRISLSASEAFELRLDGPFAGLVGPQADNLVVRAVRVVING